MKIHGLQKLTLLDFPGHTACTVFLGGCNFRCPFCHNASLVLSLGELPTMEEDTFFSFLKKRTGLLEGVCITGGEPTMQKELPLFIEKIRALGFLVKLDTNGTHPAMLKELIENGLLDYAAMDVKNTPEKYPETVGIPDFDVSPILESISILKEGKIPYEFRTTVTAELHTADDIEVIARLLAPAPLYFIQNFKESDNLITHGHSACSSRLLENMCAQARQHIPASALRGSD